MQVLQGAKGRAQPSPSLDPELSLWAGTGAIGEGLRLAEFLGIRVLADQDGGGQTQFLLPHTGGGLGSAWRGAGLDVSSRGQGAGRPDL